MKQILVMALKIGLSVGILGYLVWDAIHGDDGSNVLFAVLAQPKRWDLLAAAWFLSAGAVLLTLVRWCFLVRAVGITFRLRDALRIGFLGYLFNLAPMGIVGGDLLKAVMLARERPGYRTRAVASVLMDRIIGLYVLFVVATVGVLWSGFWSLPNREIHVVCRAVLLVTLVSTLAAGLILFVPRLLGKGGGRPKAEPAVPGNLLASALEAVEMYRRNLPVLLTSGMLTVGVHVLFTLSIFLVARGLTGGGQEAGSQAMPPLGMHFVIYPVSSIAGTIPLPAGPMETGLVFMYTRAPDGLALSKAQALVVALVFRLLSLLIAAVGFCYYLGSRRELAEVLHEVEQDSPTELATATSAPNGDCPAVAAAAGRCTPSSVLSCGE